MPNGKPARPVFIAVGWAQTRFVRFVSGATLEGELVPLGGERARRAQQRAQTPSRHPGDQIAIVTQQQIA